jgi:23S rRNA pseudouridine2605 synthase
MRRSKSTAGKRGGATKGKGERKFRPNRSHSAKARSNDTTESEKPFGKFRSVKTKPGKKSFRSKSEDKPARPEGDRNRPERRDYKGDSGRPAGRSFSSPRREGDRPERFKRDGDRPERRDTRGGSGRPAGRSFSSPRREGDRPERFKRDGDRPEKRDFKRGAGKPSGYLRRDSDRSDRFKRNGGDSEKPKTRNDSEQSFNPERAERRSFPEKKYNDSDKFSEKKKRKRIGDDENSSERKEERGDGGYKSPRSTQRSDSPRAFGENKFEKKPFGDSRGRGSFEKRKDDERPWNRKEKHEFYGERKKPAPAFLKSSEDGTTRLNKYIANAGICSRREADELIEAGLVSVNGNIITELGFKVKADDVVKYNNELLRGERLVYILLNKPKDFITTTDDPEDRKTVMSLIAKACKERVYPVGRLDRNTTGVLLFTNDGDLAKKLTHPSFQVHKVYQVELDRSLKGTDFELIANGVQLEDGFIKPDEIVYTGPDKNVLGVELHSGKNRIVRRIFEHLGYEVKKLDRVVFAELTKKDLPRGRWRFLTDLEVANLKMITGKKGVKLSIKH